MAARFRLGVEIIGAGAKLKLLAVAAAVKLRRLVRSERNRGRSHSQHSRTPGIAPGRGYELRRAVGGIRREVLRSAREQEEHPPHRLRRSGVRSFAIRKLGSFQDLHQDALGSQKLATKLTSSQK